MIFPTIEFAAFFVVVMAASWRLMPRPRLWKPFILCCSYFFYGYADERFALLLLASTVVNQATAGALGRWPHRRILAVGIVCDLGLLGWFKYYGFFALSVDRTLERIGLPAPLPLLQVALPVGISFFTFQAMSYLVDVRRGHIRPAKTIDFAVYLAFFPHLVAGPIVRADEFIPQLAAPRNPDQVQVTRAVFLIAGGLFKKVALADLLASQLVDPVLNTPSQHSSPEVLVAVYGYAVQIYCDFSAYSDMAVGIALLLGFHFPDNFDRPFTAASLQEFWRRWHMTLSRWLRDYVYIPLGGSRAGPRRTYANLLATMTLGGLWHGAAWTFVIWGAVHGAALSAERWWVGRRPHLHGTPPLVPDAVTMAAAPETTVAGLTAMTLTPMTPAAMTATAVATAPGGAFTVARLRSHGRAWLGRVAVFHFVCATWVLFRSPDLGTAMDIFVRLFTAPGPAPMVTRTVLLAIAAGLATQMVPKNWWLHAQDLFSRLSMFGQVVGIVAFVLLAHTIVGRQDVAPFVYFRF
ncbi:MBOAT family O-acyltransferase [Candidatus Protofrankia californiensis]|uniref:MBOAT family O-acyltransferase n=1 Tax=Candidatus Protofrankia californiensis TaxID=1839754 RepID=UPI0010414BA3|nr:MBOAT family protein [Candidatus Protofrankia californiensis]